MNNKDFLETAFLNSENSLYIIEQFQRYLTKPSAVSGEWATFFENLHDDERLLLLDLSRGSTFVAKPQAQNVPARGVVSGGASSKDIELSLVASSLANAYRRWGHFSADLDPLGLLKPKGHKGLNAKINSLKEADLDAPIKGFKIGRRNTLRGMIEQLSSVYCQKVGFEYMHLPNMDEVEWIKRRLETAPFALTEDAEIEIYGQLVKAELFETFLSKKFPGAKRFGLEGCDALIPIFNDILTRAAADDLGSTVIGMAHRGRLNTLYNVMGRPLEELFALFKGKAPNSIGQGDVKYHMGASTDVILHDNPLHVSLLYNPSHLEAINPIVMGNIWSKQQEGQKDALGVLVHGDAAFAGQGVNAETFLMSQVKGYSVGGMIHVITNNQVGFTAAAAELKSSNYASDLAKSVDAPVFHVNADDIESCIFVSWLAYTYRQEFKKDVVIDLIGYRRNGHNEGDEPRFTQPVMYSKIKQHPSALSQYETFLINKQTLSVDKAKQIKEEYTRTLSAAFDAADAWEFPNFNKVGGKWAHVYPNNHETLVETGVELAQLKQIGNHLSTPAEGIETNSKILRQLVARKDSIAAGNNIDWATGELLAYGSLLVEGVPVRISGEDAVRGTFSHRHVGVYDQSTNQPAFSINALPGAKAMLQAYNSVLSEYGVMGFDYGVSLANPNRLVIWEAQFGDFANGAQILIDQFLSAAESKWNIYSGLVLLLPHGLEGQGPEHSSARLERFLQLCANNNMRVINPTTPANIFHALRRQVCSPNRKPLVVMTPKSLLRHKLAVSELSEFEKGTSFKCVIQHAKKTLKPRKIVFCSGKVYYDLLESLTDDVPVQLVRVEQLYPFPAAEITDILKQHTGVEMVWCQEEPQNMGAWAHVYFEFKKLGAELSYVGRSAAPSPASGYNAVHQQEQLDIINSALSVKGK